MATKSKATAPVLHRTVLIHLMCCGTLVTDKKLLVGLTNSMRLRQAKRQGYIQEKQ